MKSRCYNPNFDGYADYGGRGITVAERWLESFESFLEDMGECPSNKHSIERVNNDGNYEPGNCKWATDIEQASNRRTNRYLEYQGRKYTVTSLARLVSIPRGTLNSWLNIYHYTDEQVINAIDQRLAA